MSELHWLHRRKRLPRLCELHRLHRRKRRRRLGKLHRLHRWKRRHWLSELHWLHRRKRLPRLCELHRLHGRERWRRLCELHGLHRWERLSLLSRLRGRHRLGSLARRYGLSACRCRRNTLRRLGRRRLLCSRCLVRSLAQGDAAKALQVQFLRQVKITLEHDALAAVRFFQRADRLERAGRGRVVVATLLMCFRKGHAARCGVVALLVGSRMHRRGSHCR